MRQSLFVTSDLITYVLNYIAAARRALREGSGLGLVPYRMLAYLADHVDGAGPSALARILETTPAMMSICTDELVKLGFLIRTPAPHGPERELIAITKLGIDAARDGDAVLARAHEEYFACLPTDLKAVVDTGSMATNTPTRAGNRMRDGHFFTAFETLHAFLTVERFLTHSSRLEGLSLNGFRVLFELGQHGRAVAAGQLGHALVLAPSAVTYAVDALESDGFVQRASFPGDKRRHAIELTSAGRERLDRATKRIEAVFTTDIRSSGASERDSYKDAAALVVADLQRHMQRANQNH